MLHCYGENSFTFLLFQALQECNGLVKPMLSNLKPFSSDNYEAKEQKQKLSKLLTGKQETPEVWLFPNFGTSSGFGEPDAIVLYKGHSFWFEVETNFNLKSRISSARISLIQLLRFHYLNRALARGYKVRTGIGRNHKAVMGPTITNKVEIKDGILRVAGHTALGAIGKKLIQAAKKNSDHYILLSDNKMKGISDTETQQSALDSFFELVTGEINNAFDYWSNQHNTHQSPTPPNIKRFWYQYYEGDLKGKVDDILTNPIKQYVPISSG